MSAAIEALQALKRTYGVGAPELRDDVDKILELLEEFTAAIEKSVLIGDLVSVENFEHPHYADTHRWPVVITFEGDEGYWHQRGETFVEALLLDPLEITKRNIAHDVKNGNEPFIPCPVCLQPTEKKDAGVDTRWECRGVDCDGVYAGDPVEWQAKSQPTPDSLLPEEADRG